MKPEIKQRIEQLNNGKIPKGYQKTDFGVFPSDWVTDKKLIDIGNFGKGKGIPGNKIQYDGVPCVGYGDIYMKYNHFHFEEAQSFVDEETAKDSQLIKKGTLLFTGTGETAEEIGKCVCYNGDSTIYAGGDIITFVPQGVNPLFLAYQQYQNFSLKKKASFGQGHSVVHIQKESLEKLNVAYPESKNEQSRIVEILMKWDKAIELYDKQIDALTRYKAVCLRKMFPAKGQNVPEWRFQGFSGDWKRRKVSEITLFHKQGFYTTESYDDAKKYYLLRGTDLAENRLILKDTPKINATEKDYQAFKTQVGDFLIVRSGNAGTYGVVYEEIPAIFGSYLIDFRFDKSQVTNEFFGYFYQSDLFKSQLQQIIQHSANTNINAENIKSTSIKLPSIIEQKRIGLFFTKIDNLITLHQCKKEAITNQRKTLQQYLLNGIVRV